MKKFIIEEVTSSTSTKLIKQYLKNYECVTQEHNYGEHTVFQSEIKEYVKAAYFNLKLSGPCQENANKFLENRMISSHFYVPQLNSLLIEEFVPNTGSLFDIIVYQISLYTGESCRLDLEGYRIKGVRTSTAELIVSLEQSVQWEWALFDLLSGTRRAVFKGGYQFYQSADGNLFFPLDSSSQIAMVDLCSGKQLDIKNKRHFSRFATKVKILYTIHFDPEQPSLFMILMKQQDLSFASLKNEVCIKLTITD
ncbi:MAG: hypothetical protein HQL46_12975 [Gammaproteobacteria bacterium]|nr:hypothetical protein [Gammaproteobacteria bacterium]